MSNHSRAARSFIPAILLLLVFAAGAPGAAQVPASSVDLDEIADYVARARADWGVPGVSVGIVHRDSVIFLRGFGVRNLETREPVDEHTLFAIGSTSKSFTSAALGILVDEGRLAWNDRAVDVLPGFRMRDDYATGAITVRDLLSHTSGLPRGDFMWYASEYDRDEVVRRVRHLEPGWGFRERYGYQNIMFVAAGQIIPALTGQSWDDFLAARFFRPLGMARTNTSVVPLARMSNVASPHARVDGQIRPVPWRNIDNAGPAGSINSSAAEMTAWVRLHLNLGEFEGRRILSEEALGEIFTPNSVMRPSAQERERFPETHLRSYGLAWFLRDYRGHGFIGHGGAIDGMRGELAFIPGLELGVVVLSNLGGSSFPNAVLFGILDRFIGPREKDWSETLLAAELEGVERTVARRQELEESRIRGTSPALDAEAYAGTYEQDFHGSLTVTSEDGGLVVRRGPNIVGDLEHWHHDTFQVRWRDVVMGTSFIHFTVSPRGAVRSAELDQYGAFTRTEDPS